MCSGWWRFVESWWGTSCSVFAESALSGCWHVSISLWVSRLRLPRGRTQLWPELRNVHANVYNVDDDSVRLRTFDYHLKAVEGLLSPACVEHIFWQTLKINWQHFEVNQLRQEIKQNCRVGGHDHCSSNGLFAGWLYQQSILLLSLVHAKSNITMNKDRVGG